MIFCHDNLEMLKIVELPTILFQFQRKDGTPWPPARLSDLPLGCKAQFSDLIENNGN